MQFLPIYISDNEILTALIFVFVLIDILTFKKDGFLRHEIEKLKELRQVRTFNKNKKGFKTFRTLLFFQYYIFFGLCLYLAIDPNPAVALKGLYDIHSNIYLVLALCISAPFIWFLIHLFLFHWFGYIFGGNHKMAIIDRIYFAYHIIASPMLLAMFIFFVVADIPSIIVAILLCAFFIIIQILLIYSVFAIFSNNKSSFYIILLYLCALEIAPLAIIYAKMSM